MTTELVVVEVGNFLSPVATRRLFPAFVAALRNNRRITVVDCSTALMRRGVEFYRARADKSWSLTDCVSFVVMHDASLDTALTADYHFEQAGFQCLLR